MLLLLGDDEEDDDDDDEDEGRECSYCAIQIHLVAGWNIFVAVRG
jgi:hypothetical protein